MYKKSKFHRTRLLLVIYYFTLFTLDCSIVKHWLEIKIKNYIYIMVKEYDYKQQIINELNNIDNNTNL